MFVATGEYGTILMSPDGETWTPESSGTSKELRSVTYGGNQFMTVGRQGIVITSVDGSKWSISNKKPDSDLNSVIYSSNRFMAVGASGCIISSVDGGATWTSVDRYSTTYQELSTVTYGNNLFLVVSGLNEALISGDGIKWTINKIRIPNGLHCATFGNGQFVVGGVVAAVMSSPDGVTWTRRTKDASYLLSTLYGVIYAQEKFVAVGDTILISKKDAMPVISNDFVNRMNKRIKVCIKNGSTTISLPSTITDKSQKMFVQIFTPSGCLLYSLPVSQEQSIFHFRATGLTTGTYIIYLMRQDKRFTSSCILIQ
jgi:hypothetical protein